MNEGSRRRVSIVTPVYNEVATLPTFYERLAKTLAPLEDR